MELELPDFPALVHSEVLMDLEASPPKLSQPRLLPNKSPLASLPKPNLSVHLPKLEEEDHSPNLNLDHQDLERSSHRQVCVN